MGKRQKEQYTITVNASDIVITSPDKPVWPEKGIAKLEYLHYLSFIAPYILPFLKERTLTVIRYPHGVQGERFYQKNCPEYAPTFVETFLEEDIHYCICSNLETLLWLGNQLALEMHIPFRRTRTSFPSEIVMDLDPPSRSDFGLAVEASLIIKEVCDSLRLVPYVKTSGNKGMQVYIPIPDHSFTFVEARMFTSFLADYLINKEPDYFTTERLKKKRGQKCYIDFIQHAEGKTIIAPYSARGNSDALVATPVYWHEVNSSLRPELFTVDSLKTRIKSKGDPFSSFWETKTTQPFQHVLHVLKERRHLQ
ncbi:non-homologous end-joining DNA ligase [Fictibacillus iocasae]|uniref:Non-homologous end-joining DNA ligase n=1 Tax=Fictibacillus iocasae TaxID=2715437 RepID=A0ABW2NMS3_9BACL